MVVLILESLGQLYREAVQTHKAWVCMCTVLLQGDSGGGSSAHHGRVLRWARKSLCTRKPIVFVCTCLHASMRCVYTLISTLLLSHNVMCAFLHVDSFPVMSAG